MPKVSVVIPLYNGEKFIRETIESVLKQKYKDYEIIVVDDGSLDNGKRLLQPYIECNIIRYIPQNNQGAANARNRGIHESRGEYIAFLDQDDIWLPQKLGLMVKKMEADRDIVCIGSWMLDIDEEGNPLGCNWFICPGIVNYALKEGNALPSSSSLVRKSVLYEHSIFFDQSFWPRDDYHMWVRLAQYGKVMVLPRVLYLYRHHKEQNIRKYRFLKPIPLSDISRIRDYRRPTKLEWFYWKHYWRLSLFITSIKLSWFRL